MKTLHLYSLAAIVLLCISAHATAQGELPWSYKVLEKQKLAKPYGFYRKTRFSRADHILVAHSVVIRNRTRYRARIIDLDEKLEKYPSIIDIAVKHHAQVAINGGYFLPNFRPAGLLLYEGKKRSPLSRQVSLSGILSIDAKGKITILPRKASLANSYYAIQAGPFIIDPGGEMGIKSAGALHRRTVVGLTKGKNIFMVNTSPVSLLDLADLLKHHPRAFGLQGVDRALNLDGGPSSAIYVKLKNKEVTIKEKLAVRNFIVIAP